MWYGTGKTDTFTIDIFIQEEHIDLLEKIPNWFWEQDLDEKWNKTYTLLHLFSFETPILYIWINNPKYMPSPF